MTKEEVVAQAKQRKEFEELSIKFINYLNRYCTDETVIMITKEGVNKLENKYTLSYEREDS